MDWPGERDCEVTRILRFGEAVQDLSFSFKAGVAVEIEGGDSGGLHLPPELRYEFGPRSLSRKTSKLRGSSSVLGMSLGSVRSVPGCTSSFG